MALAGDLLPNYRGKVLAATNVTRGEFLSLVQRFAQVFGAAYLLVGLAGFIPLLLLGGLPPGVLGPFDGLQLGVFAVNWFHSVTHALIGVVGLAVYRSFSGSRSYVLALGVAYMALFLLGVLTRDVSTLGGLLPLNGADDILHLLTSLGAFVVYLTARLPENERRVVDPRA